MGDSAGEGRGSLTIMPELMARTKASCSRGASNHCRAALRSTNRSSDRTAANGSILKQRSLRSNSSLSVRNKCSTLASLEQPRKDKNTGVSY